MNISIVVPVYNAESSLPVLVERLHQVMKEHDFSYEAIFVDDGSKDASWDTLLKLREQYTALKLVRLATNCGQHNALLAGLNQARGKIVITMDDDLQNPPEEIPKLIAPLLQGFDLAIGAYLEKHHARARNIAGNMIDGVIRHIFHLPPSFQLTSFRAASAEVVRNACEIAGGYPYITAMLLANSKSCTNVQVTHEKRHFGHSNYTLKRSLVLAMNLLFSYSTYPIWLVLAATLFSFAIAFAFGMYVLIVALIYQRFAPGWASTVVIVSLFSAMTLFCLSIFGLYLMRLSQQILHVKRPYRIKDIHE